MITVDFLITSLIVVLIPGTGVVFTLPADTVFKAIHEGDPDPQLLAYQYLQVLPQIAQGDANKVWVIPSELTRALGGISERVLPRSGEKSDTT